MLYLTLTNASARVFEFTSVTEFVIVNLPAANTLSISNGKFVFRNEGAKPFGVRNEPTSCGPCILERVNQLKQVYNTYENTNE